MFLRLDTHTHETHSYIQIITSLKLYLSLIGYVLSDVKATMKYVVLYCGRITAANAPGCTPGLLYKPWSLVIPTCTARCLHQRP